MVMKYLIVYEREPDGRWTVEAPNVPGCHSYGRTIEQARERIREALSLFVDHAATAKFEERINLPEQVLRTVEAAKELRRRVARDTVEMTRAQQKAVLSLRRMKLGLRDAGTLLGVSHQRVQQIENDLPVLPGAITVTQRTRSHFKRAAKKR
jgi:predicted RNase H-like HicB family nuclease